MVSVKICRHLWENLFFLIQGWLTYSVTSVSGVSTEYVYRLHSNVSLLLLYFIHTSLYQRRQWHPTPVLLPGKSHGWRSLMGCSPWGRKELDMSEWLHFHFSLSCIGEGNGNPLQCSCLENPRDSGAWWAAVYRVAQSQTRLKRLSSSSNLYLLNAYP